MKNESKKLEYRNFTAEKLQVQESREQGERAKIVGYASVFNSDSEDLGYFVEQVRAGAFKRTLKEQPDVRALVDHDTGKVIARTINGTLELKEDGKGLLATIIPANTTVGNDILENVRNGNIDKMSFGFSVREDSWGTKNGKMYRELIDVDLYEVSLVAFPAYPDTSANVRSLMEIAEVGKNKLKVQDEALRNKNLRQIVLLELE